MPSPTAAEILERTRALYATCRTLSTDGVHTQVIIRGEAPWQRETSRELFRHVVERAGNFLLDRREVGIGPEIEWQRRVAWKHGATVRAWSTQTNGIQDPTDLQSAVMWSSPTRALTELGLMFPGLLRVRHLPDLETATLSGQEDVDGTSCDRIEGHSTSSPIPAKVAAWVDSGGALRRLDARVVFSADAVRRLHERSLERVERETSDPAKRELARSSVQSAMERSVEDYVVDSTTTWRPRFDVEIAPATFEFAPPDLPGFLGHRS